MKRDIIDRNDIVVMVNTFYHKVQNDKLLGPVFNDIMQVNWEKHLDKMYNFWEFILFQKGGYKGQPFQVHEEVNKKEKLTDEHFNHWIALFKENIDTMFEGQNAEIIKTKASNLKEIWNYKMNFINKV